jgi:hypothetical protein
MAREALTKTTLSKAVTGNDLSAATFKTLTLGANNGVYWTYAATDLIVLKNDTGGAAVYTLDLTTPAAYTALGISVTDPTITLADGKTVILRVIELFRDANRRINIDCDVAAKLLVYDVAP